MSSRIVTTGWLLLLVACAKTASAQAKSIEGSYRNPALGYSIKIPPGLKGIVGQEDGPHRGVRIPLPSGGDIVVFGEPNSVEYKSPEDGVKEELKLKGCESAQQQIQPATLGKIEGSRGRLVCGDRVLFLSLAFRSQGGPIYWLRLETTRARESDDQATLNIVAASFRLIRWQ
jgi:hypothetical protein